MLLIVARWTDTPLDRQKKAEAARARQIHTLAVEAVYYEYLDFSYKPRFS